jgi:hypothetical protein
MSDRTYSPVSPYGRAYDARSYASKGNKMFSYLKNFASEKNHKMRLGLGIAGAILFALAVFFTYLLNHEFTPEELSDGKWSKITGTITWTKSSNGKALVAFLWIMCALAVLPVVTGFIFKKKTYDF